MNRWTNSHSSQAERIGLEIHLGAMVTGVDDRGLDTNSEDPAVKRTEAPTKIWAAGIHALLRSSSGGTRA